MASVLSAARFHDEGAAYAWVELRLWPNGPICPHCGECKRIVKLAGKSTRRGVHKCRSCRKPFRVTVGTIFEASHIPLHLWLQAIHLMCSSKKGISTHQLHRTLGIGLKAAWFLSHRIREAIRLGDLSPLGGNAAVVEADETYFGNRENPLPSPQRKGRPFTKRGKTGPSGKRAAVALVERGGRVRSFHVENADKATVNVIVSGNVARETVLHTDESRIYNDALQHVAEHETVTHSAGEYVRGDVHTNSVEGFLGVFKRGMKGIYQHSSEAYLHPYLAEFDLRYNHRIALGVDEAMHAEAAPLGGSASG